MINSFTFQANTLEYSQFMGFLNVAYRDYIAARLLLRNNQLYRGVILASTTIEKYFKVFLIAKEIKVRKTHDLEDLFSQVKEISPELADALNADYISFLTKAYKLRYLDDKFNQEEEFNICICRNRTLSELDFTVYLIESGWRIKKGEKPMIRSYQTDFNNKSELLFKDNYLLSGISKRDFIETNNEHVHELRMTKDMGLVEITYDVEKTEYDGIFSREGLSRS